MKQLIRGSIALALGALLLALAAGSAGAASFGFAEPTGGCTQWGTPYCTQWSSGIGSLASTSAFRTLAKRLPLRYARVSAPYNLISDYNPSTRRCQPSVPYAHGGNDGYGYVLPGAGWQVLRSELAVVRASRLTPLVTITDGRQIGSAKTRDPKWPIPAYWNGHGYTRTVAGESYRCGVSALIKAVRDEQRAAHAQPAEWETFNEPDARSSYNGRLKGACGGATSNCRGRYRVLCAPAVGVQCGPLEAAWLYVEIARQVKSANAGGKVAALAVTRPGGYTNGYLHELIDVLRVRPAALSFHDYIDPTSNGSSLAHGFAMGIEKRWGGRFELWITESGIYLSEWAKLPPTGGSSSVHGCQYGTNHDHRLQGLGRCVDGNPRAQAAGATDFKNHLAHDGSYRNARITELFWYEFRALPPTESGRVQWDSGLLDAEGIPRASYCVLTGTTGCKGNPFRDK